jgi:hypothetical protein
MMSVATKSEETGPGFVLEAVDVSRGKTGPGFVLGRLTGRARGVRPFHSSPGSSNAPS